MTSPPDQLPTPEIANTAAVIVSYHPDELFGERLATLAGQFKAVYWVDNTPEKAVDTQRHCALPVHCLSKGINTGLASALNSGCEAALEAGFKWVVTFDQDSDVASDFLLLHIAGWKKSDPLTFMLGCNYSDSRDSGSPRFKQGSHVTTCPTVITSGCLMCLSVWDEIGRFRDDYFIDGLDHEMCLRGRCSGFVVARHGQVLMTHRIGERSVNLRIFPYLHAPVRKYYSLRNGSRNILQYASKEPAWAARKCATLSWEVFIALLLEPNRRQKFRAMFRGLRDGVRGEMGVAPDDFFA